MWDSRRRPSAAQSVATEVQRLAPPLLEFHLLELNAANEQASRPAAHSSLGITGLNGAFVPFERSPVALRQVSKGLRNEQPQSGDRMQPTAQAVGVAPTGCKRPLGWPKDNSDYVALRLSMDDTQ
jgi:hypothetical protein